jgi:hypothetical protein
MQYINMITVNGISGTDNENFEQTMCEFSTDTYKAYIFLSNLRAKEATGNKSVTRLILNEP